MWYTIKSTDERTICQGEAPSFKALVQQAMAAKVSFEGADFAGQDLSGLDLAGQNLRGASFKGANLASVLDKGGLPLLDEAGRYVCLTRAEGADFTDADFTDANMPGLHAMGACFEGARMVRSNAPCADFTTACLNGIQAHGINATGANFDLAELKRAQLAHANMADISGDGADFSYASMPFANIQVSRLPDSLFIEVEGERMRFNHANLMRATLSGNFKSAMWEGADVTDAHVETGHAQSGQPAIELDESAVRQAVGGQSFLGRVRKANRDCQARPSDPAPSSPVPRR